MRASTPDHTRISSQGHHIPERWTHPKCDRSVNHPTSANQHHCGGPTSCDPMKAVQCWLIRPLFLILAHPWGPETTRTDTSPVFPQHIWSIWLMAEGQKAPWRGEQGLGSKGVLSLPRLHCQCQWVPCPRGDLNTWREALWRAERASDRSASCPELNVWLNFIFFLKYALPLFYLQYLYHINRYCGQSSILGNIKNKNIGLNKVKNVSLSVGFCMPITLSVLWTSPEDAYYILRSYIPHGRLLNK